MEDSSGSLGTVRPGWSELGGSGPEGWGEGQIEARAAAVSAGNGTEVAEGGQALHGAGQLAVIPESTDSSTVRRVTLRGEVAQVAGGHILGTVLGGGSGGLGPHPQPVLRSLWGPPPAFPRPSDLQICRLPVCGPGLWLCAGNAQGSRVKSGEILPGKVPLFTRDAANAPPLVPCPLPLAGS